MDAIALILKENERRNLKKKADADCNPITGYNCNSIPRTKVFIDEFTFTEFYMPDEMFLDPIVKAIVKAKSISKYIEGIGEVASDETICYFSDYIEKSRQKTDFEYVAATLFEIKNKKGGGNTLFYLNPMQKELLNKFESLRRQGIPIRIILLKFKQGGGSTFVQLYFAWIQLFLHTNWNSMICAQVENSARLIRGMYSKVLAKIPAYIVGDKKDEYLKLVPYEKANNTVVIKQRDCRITVGSAEKPNNTRAEDAALIHCSEVSFWKKTQGKSPEELIASLTSGLLEMPDTIVVYESTANGTNFFSKEWDRANGKGDHKSNFVPIFVPWFLSERNEMPICTYYRLRKDSKYRHRLFAESLTEYEKEVLWESGATLEQIAWYRTKNATYSSEWMMKQENPSNAAEAFQTSGLRKFNITLINLLKKSCTPPKYVGNIHGNAKRGGDSLKGLKFVEDSNAKEYTNKLIVWKLPDEEKIRDRYVVSVDIGGVSSKADYSVITVFDKFWMMELGGRPEKVARWKGHISHGQLAWIAVQIASFYEDALLVFESNTLETEKTEGDHLEYILNEIADEYTNLYCRNSAEVIREGVPRKYGFHMNTSTKTMIMDNIDTVLSTEGYKERDGDVCEEMGVYEIKDNGSLGAVDGYHDDNLMSTAIGVFVCFNSPIPSIPNTRTIQPRTIISEASF